MHDIENSLPLIVPFVAGTIVLALTQNWWLSFILFVVTGVMACLVTGQKKS